MKKYHRLKVIKNLGKIKGKQRVKCVCNCGRIKEYTFEHLKSGHTKSCGCLAREISAKIGKKNKKHGRSNTPEYISWKSMKARCSNPNDPYAHIYRNVTICEKWSSFENFYKDMGERPKGKTLDRINNNKGYYKENCRWATNTKQANNRQNNIVLTFNSKTMTATQWSKKMGYNRNLVARRIKMGWNIEKAIVTKPRITKN